jgi:hypothetical protein
MVERIERQEKVDPNDGVPENPADKLRRASRLNAYVVVLAVLFGATCLLVAAQANRSAADTSEAARVALSTSAAENARLRAEVEENRRQADVSKSEAECRSRIANAEAATRNVRDSAGWKSYDQFVHDRRPEAVAYADQLSAANKALDEITAIRLDSVDICRDHPDYEPPAPPPALPPPPAPR